MIYKHLTLIPVQSKDVCVYVIFYIQNDTNFKVFFILESFKCIQIIDLVF